jgi:hypothetical protein
MQSVHALRIATQSIANPEADIGCQETAAVEAAEKYGVAQSNHAVSLINESAIPSFSCFNSWIESFARPPYFTR